MPKNPDRNTVVLRRAGTSRRADSAHRPSREQHGAAESATIDESTRSELRRSPNPEPTRDELVPDVAGLADQQMSGNRGERHFVPVPENAGYRRRACFSARRTLALASACWLGDPFESTGPIVSHTALRHVPGRDPKRRIYG